MLSVRSALVLGLLLCSGGPLGADTLFSVPWGDGPGQIGYYNPSNRPNFDQPYAEGPGGLAVGPDGEVWISDPFNDRILRFDRAGKLRGTTAKMGETPIKHPKCIWVDEDRQVAVSTPLDRTVLWYNRKTKVLDRL